MFKKLKKIFKREIKPTVLIDYDDKENPNKITGFTVHHLDDVFKLDIKQVREAIIFYIEEHMQ